MCCLLRQNVPGLRNDDKFFPFLTGSKKFDPQVIKKFHCANNKEPQLFDEIRYYGSHGETKSLGISPAPTSLFCINSRRDLQRVSGFFHTEDSIQPFSILFPQEDWTRVSEYRKIKLEGEVPKIKYNPIDGWLI